MASLTDVARRAGVSVTTASLVLNPGKQECRVSAACAAKVRRTAEKLGYVPNYHAQSMRRGRAEVLAVALDIGDGNATRPELGTTYFGTLLGSIELEARNKGYQLTIVGPTNEERAPDRGYMGMRQRRFDGMIIPGVVVRTELTSFLEETHKAPIVVVEYRGTTEYPVVDWDERAGVGIALRHLAELGHRRVLWLGPTDGPGPGGEQSREKQFHHLAAELGLATEACRFERANVPTDDANDADYAEAEMLRYLHRGNRTFTAVMAWNDKTGIGACGALMKVGLRVPHDVSVVGFDNVEATLAIPRMTSVSHRLTEMGKRATAMVLEMIETPDRRKDLLGHREILQPELVIRDSTGPATRT